MGAFLLDDDWLPDVLGTSSKLRGATVKKVLMARMVNTGNRVSTVRAVLPRGGRSRMVLERFDG